VKKIILSGAARPGLAPKGQACSWPRGSSLPGALLSPLPPSLKAAFSRLHITSGASPWATGIQPAGRNPRSNSATSAKWTKSFFGPIAATFRQRSGSVNYAFVATRSSKQKPHRELGSDGVLGFFT